MPLYSTNDIPRNYVPGRGRVPSRVMFVGEAPGEKENASGQYGPGWPFIGQAGQELDRYMSWGAGLFRQDIYLTNLYKYWPLCDWKGKQLPPTAEQIASGEPELLMEIALVQPEVIVAVGAHAARYFLGERFQSMKRDAGVPRAWRDGIVVIPVTHPAAGLHQDREQVNIQRDFEQLGKLLRGEIQPRPLVSSRPPHVRRRIYDQRAYCAACRSEILLLPCCDGAEEITGSELVARILAGRTQVAIDTEGGRYDPWCLTFCVQPGEGWLLRSTERECLAALNAHINAPGGICTVIFHYLACDIPVCEPHPTIAALKGLGVFVNKHRALNTDGSLTLRDTMSEYFLLGTEPKGLKPLGWRVLDADMRTYEGLVGPTEQEVSSGYIQSVFDQLKCAVCSGAGKLPKYGLEYAPQSDCMLCFGGGVLLFGKRGQPLKSPKRCTCCVQQERVLKTTDKCAACTDGLLIPPADKELVFDADKSEWRWKQPQSIGKWIRRRLEHASADDADTEAASEQTEEGIDDLDTGVDPEIADAADDEPAQKFFKRRKDWYKLEGRSDWEYVNAVVGRMPRTTLTEVEQREGGQAVTDYAVDDAIVTFEIAQYSESRLAALGLLPIREQDAAFIPMLSRMEQIGMRIDRAHFERLDAHLNERLDAIRESLAALIGKRTNPNSPVMADVLFRELGLPSIKFTKSGARESIDDDVLGALSAQLRRKIAANPSDEHSKFALAVVEHITDYREVRKITDYTRPILQYSDRDDRIHTTLNYTSVATGRLSSSEPINLQTLPNPDNYPVEYLKVLAC